MNIHGLLVVAALCMPSTKGDLVSIQHMAFEVPSTYQVSAVQYVLTSGSPQKGKKSQRVHLPSPPPLVEVTLFLHRSQKTYRIRGPEIRDMLRGSGKPLSSITGICTPVG